MGKKRNNSAGRIFKMLHEARRKPDSKKIIEAWSDVLQVEEDDGHSRAHLVAEALSLLRDELNVVENEMTALGFSDDLYLPYLRRCRSALNISNMQASWSSPKAQIKDDTLLSLRLCSELMEDEEVELDEEELNEIVQMVHELRALMENSDLSTEMRVRVRKHLDMISSIVQKTPLVGASALRDGFREGVREIVEDEREIVENSQNEIVAGTVKAWGCVRKAGGAFVEADKVTRATLSVLQRGGDALRLIGG